MANAKRSTCRMCGRHKREMGPISHGGYCGECGPMIHVQANDDMHFHRGYYFNKWRRAHAAAAGAFLLEDLPASVREQILDALRDER